MARERVMAKVSRRWEAREDVQEGSGHPGFEMEKQGGLCPARAAAWRHPTAWRSRVLAATLALLRFSGVL